MHILFKNGITAYSELSRWKADREWKDSNPLPSLGNVNVLTNPLPPESAQTHVVTQIAFRIGFVKFHRITRLLFLLNVRDNEMKGGYVILLTFQYLSLRQKISLGL